MITHEVAILVFLAAAANKEKSLEETLNLGANNPSLIADIVALTDNMDTLLVTQSVKDVLSSNSLGQKVKILLVIHSLKVDTLNLFISISGRPF